LRGASAVETALNWLIDDNARMNAVYETELNSQSSTRGHHDDAAQQVQCR
jgi:hypothetical protein